ncbi:DUF2911 domain-containing protein [Rubrivirga litoralis]|uniref:DUF2911 domain-containing protein n=1 Tax=Rubrivirga litoralis TaxID=3075598 RepID=A0ABU3BMA5_9BACT|nr:DUF2911 domain-containing protein [Rubrivirga sp. F394]MDT0630424.1 DUF2911 domain-containing protein [Rubrivirga sp. F394]
MRLPALAAVLLVLSASAASAQRQLAAPLASPHARVAQTIGLTDLAVDYHRPAVGGRTVWGELVPYGEVWRAGANENTVFTTSTDIQVEGATLPAGTYGLHVIPTDGDWTVIFSTVSEAWGSYSYDPSEDALRVAVTPRAAPPKERLAYRFDAPDDDSATLVLHWAGREVPVRIGADTPAVVLASMERELRGVGGFFPEGWDQIAAYALDAGRRLDDALAWADRSVELRPGFGNRMTRAGLLDALGRSDEAAEARDAAYADASEEDVRTYARARRRAGDAAGADAALGRLGGRP